MATLAFTVIASINQANAVVLALVATAGQYIDNQWLFTDSGDQIKGPNLDLQNSAEGGPALGLIGQECRVRGQVIFQSRPYGEETDIKVDVAIAIANDGTILDGIEVVRIYAEGYELFTGSGTMTTGPLTDITISHSKVRGANEVTSVIDSPANGFDLTKFRVFGGHSLSMQGWNDPGNNWGFGGGQFGNKKGWVLLTHVYPDGSTYISAVRDDSLRIPEVSVNESASSSLTPEVIQEFPPVNETFLDTDGVEIKTGVAGQVVSDVITGHVEDAPAMERTAYVTLKGLKLKQFGQRLPDLVTIASTSETPVTLPEAVDAIHERAGWEHTLTGLFDWDTSELDSSKIVRGYTILEEGSVHEKMLPLVFAYDISMQVRDGVAFYFHQENSRFFTVDENDWGAISEEPGEDGLTFNSLTKSSLPTKVSVNFVDRNTGWEDASVDRHIASPAIISEDTVEIDLRSLTMTMPEAVEIAERLLWRPHRLGRPWRGPLPARYLYILENDIINTTFNGRAIQLKVTKAERGQDRTLRLEGRVFLPDPPRSVGF